MSARCLFENGNLILHLITDQIRVLNIYSQINWDTIFSLPCISFLLITFNA